MSLGTVLGLSAWRSTQTEGVPHLQRKPHRKRRGLSGRSYLPPQDRLLEDVPARPGAIRVQFETFQIVHQRRVRGRQPSALMVTVSVVLVPIPFLVPMTFLLAPDQSASDPLLSLL